MAALGFRQVLFIWLLLSLDFVTCSAIDEPLTYLQHQRRALAAHTVLPRKNISTHELSEAQRLTADAARQQGIYNAYRFAHPKRNAYTSKNTQSAHGKRDPSEPLAPTLNSSVIAAAVLIAEHNAALQHANGTLHKMYSQPKTLPKVDGVSGNEKRANNAYWMADIAHSGQAPMGSNPSYPVFRDVTNPLFAGGAKGDGLHDDTAAIQAAISYGSNCGAGCESSSIKGTLIYFPPGTYLISTPIEAYYYSQLVGNPNNRAVIKTSQQFIGLGAIESDVYVPNGNSDEWYVEQSNFFRQVRNLVIDIRDTTTYQAAALHWQVAQATSLTNVYIYASTVAGNTQRAIFTENGSGGFMSDCFIQGGQYGLYGGNQQYTVTNFEFSSQTEVSIALLWDWGWTWSRLTIASSPVGILMINPEAPSGQQAGSVYIMDSLFDGVDTAIKANALGKTILETSIITLDNIGILNVNNMISFSDGYNLHLPTADTNFVVIGNAQLGKSNHGYFNVDVQDPPRSLLGDDSSFYRSSYFVKKRPQYSDVPVGSIVNVKDHGALGNGVHDDTSAVAAALALATTSNVVYFPAGSYIITSTVVVPPHTRMTGEVWSQLVASGTYFASSTNPKPMIQVGTAGDVGDVEISDMLFTSIGSLPGLIMMEWNVQAASPGSTGMWDAHFRVGGAYGTKLQVGQCPKTSTIQPGCIAAAIMLHVTSSANGYFENVWAWVADHDIDDATNTMVTVAVARGILIESSGPTWLYGTSSEHSMLYQYNFYNSSNTFAGMIQTESPYFQGTAVSQSPGPFSASVGQFGNDPIFEDGTCTGTGLVCDVSWAVIIEAVNNLTIAGAGLYSWFANYDQDVCVDAQNCQQRLVKDGGSNAGLYIWNLITIGATEMISNTDSSEVVLAANNTQSIMHPFWSALAGYLEDYASAGSTECDDDDQSPACDTPLQCDQTRQFSTMDQLIAANSTYDNICVDYYALGVLQTTLQTAVTNYSAVNKGYDAVFDDYASYVKDMVGPALQKFMADPTVTNQTGGAGNKYFDCTLTLPHKNPVTQQCPFDYSTLSVYNYNMKYTLKDSAGFYAAVSSEYGIQQSWVKFGRFGGQQSICSGRGGSCISTDKQKDGYPLAADSFTVPNPKDIIAGALPNITALQNDMSETDLYLATNSWYGEADDVLQTYSMPVIMITSALDAMAAAKSIGKKVAKEKKIAKILEILGIVLIFVPFLDDIAPELGVLNGVFSVVAVAGDVSLGIQQIVSDPSSAPMAILGAISGAGVRSENDFAKIGSARRGLGGDELKKIGNSFADADAKFQNVIKHECRL